jgi:hypothetical protein
MDYHYIKLTFSGILQELPEEGTLLDGLMSGRFPFFPIASAWDPASGLA